MDSEANVPLDKEIGLSCDRGPRNADTPHVCCEMKSGALIKRREMHVSRIPGNPGSSCGSGRRL